MQFQYNADFPGLSTSESTTTPTSAPVLASNPLSFPPAQPVPCARITTRVFHPSRHQVATVQNVLVRTVPFPGPSTSRHTADDDSFSSAMSSSSSSSSGNSMKLEDDGITASTAEPGAIVQWENSNNLVHNAYWIQRTIREAIYGRVLFAVVLKRRPVPTDGAEWEVTSDHCAVKEMAWAHIRKEKDRLAEDPIKEVSAMQYIQKWFENNRRTGDNSKQSQSGVAQSFHAMRECNIMMPLDLLTDERNLYSIMPYCDGGELFERLDLNERFSEEEARYWMDQVLNVSVHSWKTLTRSLGAVSKVPQPLLC